MSADPTPSRQSIKRSRRTTSQDSEPAQAAVPSSAPSADSSPTTDAIKDAHAIVVNSRRKRYTDNRPVDPSPIQVSQTVRMAGLRPIGSSPHSDASANFSQSPMIMNRPIAPNNTPQDDEMLGYLD
jgi:hypothetical protein